MDPGRHFNHFVFLYIVASHFGNIIGVHCSLLELVIMHSIEKCISAYFDFPYKI